MKKYRNTKTNAVIITNDLIGGGDWIEVVEEVKAEQPKKKSARKKKESV